MSHTSGLSGWQDQVSLEDIYDHEFSVAKLAQQAPLWEPGTASGYHALTYGHLLSELIRRTTGKTLKQFVAEEIAGPLNADFQVGALEKDWPRISNILAPKEIPTSPPEFPEGSVVAQTMTNPNVGAALYLQDFPNTPAFRHADLGGINGHGNARSVAKILSVISLGGEVDGVRLLSKEVTELALQEQCRHVDLVLGVDVRLGNGFGLTGGADWSWMPQGPTPQTNIAFWGGWGGSLLFMDPARRVTMTYTMNQMGAELMGTERSISYLTTVYKILEG